MRRFVSCATFLFAVVTLVAAQSASGNLANTSCTFQDGKELSLRYDAGATKSKIRVPEGKLWSPGGQPMALFTQVGLQVGDSEIPIGAYNAYLIPQHNNWVFVVNKSVGNGSKYDEREDVLRAPMQAGHLSESQPLSIVFGHIAPKQCNLRIYLGKIGTWVEFKEKEAMQRTR
jgi:hypothetical protein